jgi:DNA-binding transcriptional ArsR family regulator
MVMQPNGNIISSVDLDAVFGALADSTRRAILTRLAEGPACVQDIAEPFAMSQAAISKHLKVLQNAGLIARNIDKQKRPAYLHAAPMAAAVDWLTVFGKFWTTNFDQLDVLLANLKNAEKQGDGHG